MNCKNCGFPLTNDNDRCPSCGTPNELFNKTVDPVQNATSIQDAPISESTGPAIQSTTVIPTMSNESTKIDDDIFVKPTNEEGLGTPIKQIQGSNNAAVGGSSPERKRMIIIVIISVVVVLALVGVVIATAFGSSGSSSGNGNGTSVDDSDETDLGWTTMRVDDVENEILTIKYTLGMPEDYEIYKGVTLEDISNELVEQIKFKDEYGEVVKFEPAMLNIVASLIVMTGSEYERLELTDKDDFENFWAVLAAISYEFTNDKFKPESVIYNQTDDEYYFYGTLDSENEGDAVIKFGGPKVFEGVQCGDHIYWKIDFNNPTYFNIGKDINDLTFFEIPGVETLSMYMKEIINNVVKE